MMYSSVHIWKDARIFFKEAQSLAKEYDVEFYAIGDSNEAENYENDHLKIYLLPKRSRLQRYKNWITLLKEIRRSKASYYHYHDPELLLLLPFLRKKRKNHLFIYDMHENFPKALTSKNWLPKFIKPLLLKIVKPLEKRLLKKNHGVIYAEKSYKEEYFDIAPFVKECDIYNYPYFSGIPEMNDENIQTKETIQFVYIGRIAVVRGIWEMLHAVKEVSQTCEKKIVFKLIGQCEEELLGKIQEYISMNDLDDIVEYSPFVEYEKIWTIYQESDIGFCLLHPIPNYVGSIATKMFEYMAAGVPMIISDFPLWKQILEKSKNGLSVNPLNEKEIQSAMKLLISDSEQRRSFARNGQIQFQQEYNWENEEKKLYSFYHQLIEMDV